MAGGSSPARCARGRLKVPTGPGLEEAARVVSVSIATREARQVAFGRSGRDLLSTPKSRSGSSDHLADEIWRILRSGKRRTMSGTLDTGQCHRDTRGFERLLHLLRLREWNTFILVSMNQQEGRVVG